MPDLALETKLLIKYLVETDFLIKIFTLLLQRILLNCSFSYSYNCQPSVFYLYFFNKYVLSQGHIETRHILLNIYYCLKYVYLNFENNPEGWQLCFC